MAFQKGETMLKKQYVSMRLLPIIVTIKIMVLSIITLLLITSSNVFAEDVILEGNITDNISYKLYDNKTLVIYGEGEVVAQGSWIDALTKDDRNSVKKVIIEEGITRIGQGAFYKNQNACFKGMESITFPSTLMSIGSNAFGGTTAKGDVALKEIVFSQSGKLAEIEQGAFGGCIALQNVEIPEGVTKLGNYVFDYCTSLETISFPSTIIEYGVSILAGCTSIKTITFNAMNAAPLDYIRDDQSGGDYAGLDGYIYNATPVNADGCLRKTNGNDVVMRHPVGATGYSDDDPTPTDGWKWYTENTWEAFSTIPENVQAVIDAIDMIEVITESNYLEMESPVIAARAEYDALESQELKNQVSNYDKLTAAEASIDSYKLAAAKKAEEIKKKTDVAKKLQVKGLKVKMKSRKFTLTWKKTKGASGYQIQYRKKGTKKFSSLKTTKLKVRTKKLKKNKKYQFRVRTYVKIEGKPVYGKWTRIKTIKCR